jgi:hypothetical protein
MGKGSFGCELFRDLRESDFFPIDQRDDRAFRRKSACSRRGCRMRRR